MSACKPPQVIFHSLFKEIESDMEELLDEVVAFLNGDPGEHESDDQVLGFMTKSIQGKTRHGVYETMGSGRIHIIGDDAKVLVLPDLAFAKVKSTHGINDVNLSDGNSPILLSKTPTQTKPKTKPTTR